MKVLPQSIKLIAIDIDGTLLNPQKQITNRTLIAIQAAREAGIIVTLATARRYGNSLQFANELGIDIPLILCDGALIIDHPQQTVLHTHRLPAEIAQQAVEIMVRHKVQPVVHHINGTVEETWTGDKEHDNPEVAAYFAFHPEVKRMAHANLCTKQPEALRLAAFATEEAIDRLVPEISLLNCAWTSFKRGNYECAELTVMHKTCSKASGVTALAHHLSIPLTQVMAIGDNTNDRELLKVVGWGVAMGQAPESVKAIAHAITASNVEDGVAQAIERYALGRETNSLSNSLNRATCL